MPAASIGLMRSVPRKVTNFKVRSRYVNRFCYPSNFTLEILQVHSDKFHNEPLNTFL